MKKILIVLMLFYTFNYVLAQSENNGKLIIGDGNAELSGKFNQTNNFVIVSITSTRGGKIRYIDPAVKFQSKEKGVYSFTVSGEQDNQNTQSTQVLKVPKERFKCGSYEVIIKDYGITLSGMSKNIGEVYVSTGCQVKDMNDRWVIQPSIGITDRQIINQYINEGNNAIKMMKSQGSRSGIPTRDLVITRDPVVSFRQALKKDPTNVTAQNGLKRAKKEKARYDKYRTFRTKARKAYDAKDYAIAKTYYSQILKVYPKNGEAKIRLDAISRKSTNSSQVTKTKKETSKKETTSDKTSQSKENTTEKSLKQDETVRKASTSNTSSQASSSTTKKASTSSSSSSLSSPSISNSNTSDQVDALATGVAVVAVAAVVAAAYVGHYYYGKLFYSGEYLNDGNDYSEFGPHFNISMGQSLTFISTPSNEKLNALNIDVKAAYWPIYTPNVGIALKANGVAGLGLLFGNAHANLSLGTKLIAGTPRIKLFGEYQRGVRGVGKIYYSNSFSYVYQRFSGGLRFSLGENKNEHIELGPMWELQDDRKYLNDNYFPSIADLGGMFTYSADNGSEIFLQFIPQYYTNFSQEERGEGAPMTYFINLGYRKRFDFFHKGSEKSTKEFSHIQNKQFIFGLGGLTRTRLGMLRRQENIFSISQGLASSLMYMEGDLKLYKNIRTQVGLGIMNVGSSTGTVIKRDVSEDQLIISDVASSDNEKYLTSGESFSMRHNSMLDIPVSLSFNLPLENKMFWLRAGHGLKIGHDELTQISHIYSYRTLSQYTSGYTGKISNNISYNLVGLGIDVPTKKHAYRVSLSYEWENNSVLESFDTRGKAWNMAYYWIF